MSRPLPAVNTCISSSIPRRSFLHFASATSLGVILGPLSALAQDRPPACQGSKPYDAMVLSCIDPRIIDQVNNYMDNINKQRCRYSQFTIAGAAVGVVAPKFAAWHETFWENLASSMELHQISKVIAIDHRDCGAARIAYGARSIADRATETGTHKRVLGLFRQGVHRRHPHLEVVTGLMELDGSIELFT